MIKQLEKLETEELFEHLKTYFKNEEDLDLITLAYEVAKKFHEGQMRKSGAPYINHPLNVAIIIADLRMDAVTVAAGLLHDTLEDTQLRYDEMKRLFNEPVPTLVQGVTKINRMNFDTSHEAQIENIRKIIVAMARDIRVLVIKLADRLHNMRTLKFMSEKKQIEISQETIDIYAPLANRLGIVRLKTEIEDASMSYLYPDAYQQVAQNIDQKKNEREALINESIQFLKMILADQGFPHVIISGRPKHFYSIYQKMIRSDLTFDEIFDLNALRIFCKTKNECYEILGIVHDVWSPRPNRFKDYIAVPKSNNYQSLHTTVIGHKGMVTEIQIRTHEMHDIAEYGIAAHWAYKEGHPGQQDSQRMMKWLKDLSAWIQDPGDPNSLFDTLKQDVFADVVLCFTPKGDVIELPAQATPIDFAFSIHTKVGERCVGARVNNRMVPLRTELKHGDIVEIETSNSGHPSRDWLDVVKTGRARSKIKHWLKSREMATFAQVGRDALNRVLKERNISVNKSELDEGLDRIKGSFKLETIDEVLAEIGFKSISPQAALRRMNPDWSKKQRAPKKVSSDQPRKPNMLPISVDGVSALNMRIANCCRPIPGDPIIAFVTRGRGVTIHHEECLSIRRMKKLEENQSRILEAKWDVGHGHIRNVRIRAHCEDRSGLLLELSSILRDLNIFITAVNTRSDQNTNTAIIDFDVNIFEDSQLDRIILKFNEVRGVNETSRMTRGIGTNGKNE